MSKNKQSPIKKQNIVNFEQNLETKYENNTQPNSNIFQHPLHLSVNTKLVHQQSMILVPSKLNIAQTIIPDVQLLASKIKQAYNAQNNMAYKTLAQQQYEILLHWHSRMKSNKLKNKLFERDSVILANSFQSLYCSIILGCTSVNDTVLIFEPALEEYCLSVEGLNRKCQILSLQNSENIGVNLEHWLHKLGDKCKLVVMSNPMNPFGNILPQKQLQNIFSVCKRHNKSIILDQRLSDYYQQIDNFITGINVKNIHSNIIVINEVAKFLQHLPQNSAFKDCHKTYAIFGSESIRKKTQTYLYQGLKVLPHYLHGVLIKISYQHPQGLKYYHRIKQLTIKNYKIVRQYIGDYLTEWHGIYVMINFHKLQNCDLIKIWGQFKNEISRDKETINCGFLLTQKYRFANNSKLQNLICIQLINNSDKLEIWVAKLKKIIIPKPNL